MNANEILNALKNYKKGTYIACVWKKTVGGITKTTRSVVRFVNYFNVVKKEPTESTRFTKVNAYVKASNKSGSELLDLFTTNHHKTHSVFTDANGVILTKEVALALEPKLKNNGNISVMFSKRIEDIIAIG